MTKKLFIVFLAAVLLLFWLSATCVYVTACAEETVQETPAEPQEPATEEEPGQPDETPQEGEGGGIQALIEGFITQLKDKYGDQWQQYYDAIIAEWGTVEQYLLSLVPEDSPDVVKDGWQEAVSWLGEYSPIWGSILAAVLVIIVIVFGKKALNALKNFFLSLFRSKNKEYQALTAQNEALLALLGENPKFEENRAALKASNKEMAKDD